MTSKVTLSGATNTSIKNSACECKAGQGHCSHSIGLLYVICHFQRLGLKAIPPVQSKTSLPQTWHVPQRHEGLTNTEVHNLEINKVKPKAQATKRRRISEGVLPNVYCPVPQPIPAAEFVSKLQSELSAIQSDAQLLRYLPSLPAAPTEVTRCKFGDVVKGCPLSYQQKSDNSPHDIINHPDQPTFPDFALPILCQDYTTVLNHREYDLYTGLCVMTSTSLEIEKQTRQQSMNKIWHDVRRDRLTSSNFKDIHVRKADFDSLSRRLLKHKNIQTAAMKFGLEHEPEAAKLYGEITGNNVYRCGFVINPTAPHLGTSPDRVVYDPSARGDEKFGLLEIKCPSKATYEECTYLKKTVNGQYKLKISHQYYVQVIGQMAITGLHWCDFIVKCQNDYHMERIVFDSALWEQVKLHLDQFYFDYHLPNICGNKSSS